MLLLRIIVACLFGAGLFLILRRRLHYPSLAAVRSLMTITGGGFSPARQIVSPLAHKLEPLIHMAPYRREELVGKLKIAGSMETPESYVAKSIVSSILILLIGLLFLPVSPVIPAALAIYAIYLYFHRRRSISEKAEKRKKRVLSDMPGFAAYLIQSIKTRRDMYAVVEGYRGSAGAELGEKIDKMLVNMRTRNTEYALHEFAADVCDPLVSDLVLGLISAAKGEDVADYLAGIEARFNEQQIASLDAEAEKRPDELIPGNILLFICMMLVFFVILGIILYESMHQTY